MIADHDRVAGHRHDVARPKRRQIGEQITLSPAQRMSLIEPLRLRRTISVDGGLATTA
jgi:hypothetical protein